MADIKSELLAKIKSAFDRADDIKDQVDNLMSIIDRIEADILDVFPDSCSSWKIAVILSMPKGYSLNDRERLEDFLRTFPNPQNPPN